MGDVAVGDADPQDPHGRAARLVERLPHGGAEAAAQHPLLDRHEQVVLGRELDDEAAVDRLGEARVGDGRGDPVELEQRGGLERLADAGAVPEQRDAAARAVAVLRRRLAEDLAGPDRDEQRRVRERHADGLATRVAQRRGSVVMQGGVQHVHEHRLVARRHQHDVRQAAQVGDVEDAVVGRAVVADEAGAVDREDDREPLQADVVDDLVVGALEEGRVDRGDRARALEGEPGGEEHRLLLGDADVEVALRHRRLEDVQAGARSSSPR